MHQQNEKFLLELGEFEPSNIIVNYEILKVMACIKSKLVTVATVDLGVCWLHNNIVNEEVRDPMEVACLTWSKMRLHVRTMGLCSSSQKGDGWTWGHPWPPLRRNERMMWLIARKSWCGM